MATISFKAESVSVEGTPRTGDVMVTVEADPRAVVEGMDVDDRLYELEPRDIIDEMGALKILQAFTEEEIAAWLRDGMTDTTDMLNAIGMDDIHEYLNNSED